MLVISESETKSNAGNLARIGVFPGMIRFSYAVNLVPTMISVNLFETTERFAGFSSD